MRAPRGYAHHDACRIALPSGRLSCDITTGGAFAEYRLPPGSYHIDAWWSRVEEDDPLESGVEKVLLQLWPVSPTAESLS